VTSILQLSQDARSSKHKVTVYVETENYLLHRRIFRKIRNLGRSILHVRVSEHFFIPLSLPIDLTVH